MTRTTEATRYIDALCPCWATTGAREAGEQVCVTPRVPGTKPRFSGGGTNYKAWVLARLDSCTLHSSVPPS